MYEDDPLLPLRLFPAPGARLPQMPRRGLRARLRTLLGRIRRWGKHAPAGELTCVELHPDVLRIARRREYAVKPRDRQKGRE